MEELFQGTATADSADIIIEAPDKAQDGAAVRVSVEAKMPQVESITIIAEKNPVPLIASFHMGAKSVPYVQTIIKMGEDSNVIAVVKAGGKLYTSRKMVEVVAGGCAAP